MIRIDRCICTGRTFATLCQRAKANGWSFDQLCDHTDASRRCTMCRPYLRTAMRTGEMVFDHLLSDDPSADEGEPGP